MMGDGVNDVLPLKKANLGVAMESGSSATRSVAAIVLLGDSFEVMLQAFSEGQRIVNSIQEILKLFMATSGRGGAPYNGGRWLPTVAAAALIIVYGVMLTMPGMRRAFDLVPLPLDLNLMIVGVTLVWAATQLLIWRFQWMERFLGIETDAVLRF